MYINGQVLDTKSQKPLLRNCIMWDRVQVEDKKKVLFSGKHIQSSSAKKLAKTSLDKDKLWTFLTARQKKGPIAASMTHQELWTMMDNRINAVGGRSQHLIAENDKIAWDKCGPWDTSHRTNTGLVIVQH